MSPDRLMGKERALPFNVSFDELIFLPFKSNSSMTSNSLMPVGNCTCENERAGLGDISIYSKSFLMERILV